MGPAGYDVRVAENFILQPGDFRLASTIEKFCMSRKLVGFVHDKSTWARLGVALQNTVIEPGWRGFLTLEISNHGKNPIRIGTGMPIAQIIFHSTDRLCEPYDGKYQDQKSGAHEAKWE
jgi:dCTP deaminase